MFPKESFWSKSFRLKRFELDETELFFLDRITLAAASAWHDALRGSKWLALSKLKLLSLLESFY